MWCAASDQVMLKVTVAEVGATIIKQMGIDLSASLNVGTAVVTFNNNTPFTANNAPLVPGNALAGSFGSNPPSRRPCGRWKAPAWCGRWPNLI